MNYGNLTITNEDNMELMARFPDKHFELAIVDPPYGIGDFILRGFKDTNVKHKQITWNDETPNNEYFKNLYRVSKNQIIWGANYYNCFNGGGSAIVWYKESPHPNLSDCEIASKSFGKKVDYVKISHQKFITDKRENKSNRIHPCQKPIILYEWLLKNYAKPNDKILDTHLGSGSIAIACHYLGFDLTACELDKDYYNDAMKRIEKETRQTTMF